jgi:hypothetical protein
MAVMTIRCPLRSTKIDRSLISEAEYQIFSLPVSSSDAKKKHDDDECFFVVSFLVLSFLCLFLGKQSI